MKSLIVYKSFHHNNTKKVAETMAESIGADIFAVDELKEIDVSEYDLIGFGSGIYFGNFHISILNLVKRIKNIENKNVFIFSTSGLSIKFLDFDRGIKKELQKRGANLVGSFNSKGFNTNSIVGLLGGMNKGRPNDLDLNSAKKFVEDIRLKIS